jgi:hypothetical protein
MGRESDKPKAKKRRKKKRTMAEKADRYRLYLKSVQEPEIEVEFFDRVYKELNGRMPRILREDFCGTFGVCCDWVKRRGRRAVAVDLDPECLDWGRAHNLAKLASSAQKRVTILRQDVRTRNEPRADVLAAQNFSYWTFKTRDELRAYFRVARSNLADDGIMVLDLVGGPESYEDGVQDVRKLKGYKYVWDLASYDPITRHATFHIHFRFPDKSRLKKAFTYSWRFWTIPEVRELLAEAGFSDTTVYWEGEDEDGEGTGEYDPVDEGSNDPAWIAYVVARR